MNSSSANMNTSSFSNTHTSNASNNTHTSPPSVTPITSIATCGRYHTTTNTRNGGLFVVVCRSCRLREQAMKMSTPGASSWKRRGAVQPAEQSPPLTPEMVCLCSELSELNIQETAVNVPRRSPRLTKD